MVELSFLLLLNSVVGPSEAQSIISGRTLKFSFRLAVGHDHKEGAPPSQEPSTRCH